MRCRLLLLLPVVLSLSGQGQDAAKAPELKTPAALLPASTALYVEVRQPGVTLKELAGLLHGSCLDDYPAGLQTLRQQGEIDESLELAGLLLTPEGVKEAQHFQGMAFAVLGPRTDGGQDYVALLQPGESAMPGLLLRRFLANGDVQVAGEVEGVKLYRQTAFPTGGPNNAKAMARLQAVMMQQMRRMVPQAQIGGAPQMPMAGGTETDFALLPGLLVMGSPAGVKDVVVRAKGKGTGSRLADDARFQQASREYGDKPGVFVHGDLNALTSAGAKREADQRLIWATALQQVINPLAAPSASGGLTLDRGAISLRLTAPYAGDPKSPLIESLPNTPFQTALLQFLPSDVEGAVGLSNAEGARRWERVLEIADTLVKAADANTRLPSRQVDRIEDDLKLKMGPDVAAKITQLVVSQRRGKTGDASGSAWLALLETADEDTVKALLTDGLPKLLGACFGQRVVPTVKEIKGRALHSADLGSRGTISFGRQGKVIAVSSEAELTSEALDCGEKKQGMLNDARVAASLKELDGSAAVLIARPAAIASWVRGEGLLGRFVSDRSAVQAPFAGNVQFAIGGIGAVPAPGQPGAAVPPALPAPPPAGRVAAPGQADSSDEKLPPLVLGLTRKPGSVVIEGRLPEAKSALPKLVDRVIEQSVAGPTTPVAGVMFQGGKAQLIPGFQGPPPGGALPLPAAVPAVPPPLPPPPKDK